MRRWWWLVIAAALGMGVALVRPAAAGDLDEIYRYGVGRSIVSGGWAYDLWSGYPDMLPVTENSPVTGFAFGPGRSEIAYCAPAGDERWGLWVASVSFEGVEDWDEWPDLPLATAAPPRLLWTAPEGAELKGPVWWAPDGSRIAVQVERGGESEVVAADYGTGEAVRICRGVKVVELAWGPRGGRIAYVTEEETGRAVWFQTMPPEEPRRLGDGGFNLRWSLDGGSLSWLRPKSEDVWVGMRWDAATGKATEANPQPAREAGAMWSPDGQLCAVLEGPDGAGGKTLTIYRGTSTAGERIPLPYARPKRLLGWSPDSSLVLVLADADFPLAVAVRPIPDGVRGLVEAGATYTTERAALCGAPMEPDAGPPSWSSGGDMLAHVIAAEFDKRLGWPSRDDIPTGHLAVSRVGREYLEPVGEERVEVEQVLSNIKNVALALQMYLSDNNDVFPPTGDSNEVWGILDEYVRSRSIFMRPGTEDEMVVQYLVPPGVWAGDIEDAASTPVAVVDHLPNFYIVGYADGHAAAHEKDGDYWQELAEPWREYELRREQEEQ
jgi:hypothetical protein